MTACVRQLPVTLAVLALSGCAHAPRDVDAVLIAEATAQALPAAGAAPADAGGRAASQDIDPEVLLPSRDSVDDVVATVGDLEIHERHVYEYLVQTEPAAPRRLVEVIVLDAQVARAARHWRIELDAARVERMAAEQEGALRAEVERQLGPRLTFARYLARQFAMAEQEYRDWLRTKIVRELYRQYVLRYAAMLQDRVEVRYIVNTDRTVLEEVADRVRQGASFATLAIRHTEDDNRMEGGLLPPFGRGFDHPVAGVAFDLEVGQLSDIFMRETQGARRYYLVYCLRRIPRRDVEFAAVEGEIERAIDDRPLSSMEFRAASQSLVTVMESLNSASEVR